MCNKTQCQCVSVSVNPSEKNVDTPGGPGNLRSWMTQLSNPANPLPIPPSLPYTTMVKYKFSSDNADNHDRLWVRSLAVLLYWVLVLVLVIVASSPPRLSLYFWSITSRCCVKWVSVLAYLLVFIYNFHCLVALFTVRKFLWLSMFIKSNLRQTTWSVTKLCRIT